MDVKIHCGCGQKIAFEVEPENGAMPCSLACPACQTDVTPLANGEIRRQLPAPAVAEAPRMRISVAATHAPAAASATAEAVSVVTAPAPVSTGRPRTVVPPAPAAAAGGDDEAPMGAFLLGTLGILGGTVVGLAVWFLLAKLGLHLKIIAVVVGVGAGFGARIFCRAGDKSLGGLAALVAVIGMFMGGPMVLHQRLRITDEVMREAYQESIQEAKQLVAAIPNGTDAEITKYLGQEGGGVSEVTAEDIKEFRAGEEFKHARDLASGKRSYEAFAADFRKSEDEVHKELGGAIAGFGALRLLSVWLICLVGGTAYKIAAG